MEYLIRVCVRYFVRMFVISMCMCIVLYLYMYIKIRGYINMYEKIFIVGVLGVRCYYFCFSDEDMVIWKG